MSDKTVRNHVSNVFAKLHVTTRAGAVVPARDAGLGEREIDPGARELERRDPVELVQP